MAGPSVVGNGWTGGDGTDRERITLAGLPADAPEQGLVYDGLTPAGAGLAVRRARTSWTRETCTHGPDAAPTGLRVRRGVAPVTEKVAGAGRAQAGSRRPVPPDAEIVRDEGGSALTAGKPALVPDAAPGDADFVMGNHDVACEGDGRTGKRVQVVYTARVRHPEPVRRLPRLDPGLVGRRRRDLRRQRRGDRRIPPHPVRDHAVRAGWTSPRCRCRRTR